AAEPHQRTFDSRTTIRFGATGGSSWIDIVADEIVSATLNGSPLDVTGYDGARLELPGLSDQNELIVDARCLYSRTGEGLHRFTDPSDNATYLYTHFEPTDSRRVFAVFEQPDLKARFSFEVVADATWLIRSGQPEVSRTEADGFAAVRFAPTPPQSSYITAVAAGPYHLVTDEWSVDRADGSRLTVPLGVLCRASMAPHLDADDILTLTQQGLTYFDELFAYPYPWGKYDQIFVPEYNIGAMENPGLVTFTESYLHRGRPTVAELTSRSEVILHEMAHMWFGDLVTMSWWDGLWLKESFADLMGYQVSVEATRYTSALTMFAVGRKQWAYTQDLRPTTHPIAADIPDIEAAAQNFDGITYSKGAAAMKQLQAYVGRDAFDEGVRQYFRAHAFGCTRLEDFLGQISAASGRDLSGWAATWLRTSGPSEISVTAGETALSVQQQMPPHALAVDTRSHVFGVGLYSEREGELVQLQLVPVELAAEPVRVMFPTAGGPDLVLPNADDATYAIVRLDSRSQETAHRRLATVRDELSRALIWSALWNHVRDAQLSPDRFLQTVREQLPAEDSAVLLSAVLSMARSAVEQFLDGAAQELAAAGLARLAYDRVTCRLDDTQLVWARALSWFGRMTPDADPLITPLLVSGEVSGGATIDPELRWDFVAALSATGRRSSTQLADDLRADFTMTGQTAYDRAVASAPTPEAKSKAWHSLVETAGSGLTNDRQRALIAGFGQPVSGDLAAPYADRYFEVLSTLWKQQSQAMATRFVNGMFPGLVSGAGSNGPDPVIGMARRWLTEHVDEPSGLRRGVIEGLDDAERIQRVRDAWK
ncbi:MAG: aminopeptidase N, partial [Allobranchiibius sp.]